MDIVESIKKFIDKNTGIHEGDKVAIIYDEKNPILTAKIHLYFRISK